MSKNIIRAAFAASIAGAGLAVGAGLASADTTAPALSDGSYVLDIASPVSLGLPATVGSVPATVEGGKLIVNGVTVPGTLAAVDEDGDGTADSAAVIVGGSTWGVLR